MSSTTTLFDSSGTPHPVLLELLERFQVTHDGSLISIRNATQHAWLVPGKLRADISDDDDRALLPAYLPLFEALGHVGGIPAQGKQVEYALIGGAKRIAVEKRMLFLASQWELSAARFRIAVLLGSGRTIDDHERDRMHLFTNEAQMICKTYFDFEREGKLPWRGRDSGPFLVSHFPFATKPEGRNANVEDCVSAWVHQFNPQPQSMICVFSQPFVQQQTLAVQLALGPAWTDVFGIGYGAANTYGLRTYLDNIAKQIDGEHRLSIR